MKRCWLHIGMHKTGTTSLQTNLKRIGSTDEWEYICVGGKLHMNTPFHAMFATNPFHYHWFDKQGVSAETLKQRGENLRERLAAAITRSKAGTIIMSAEALPLVDKDGIGRLKEFLAPFFDEIRVIGYVRPPVSFKVSIFQEMVKGGRSKFELGDIKLNYRRKFEKFDTHFGRENVVLRKFDPSSFADGCTVSDFFATIGLTPPPRETIKRTNESMSLGACGILYVYRRFGPGYGSGPGVVAENLQLIKILLAMKGDKFSAAPSIVANGLEKEAADIRWMESRLGASLSENLTEAHGITSEADLLNIPRATVDEFVKRVRTVQKYHIPPELVPTGDPADPEELANLVEHIRGVIREEQRAHRALQERRRKGLLGFWRRIVRKFRKAAGRA
ncbi:MAG: hypothetical protein H7A48_10270 [Akkermansiaceae bacterium]|nr:hypothetical protein [Akkermansiaceae bacterium]